MISITDLHHVTLKEAEQRWKNSDTTPKRGRIVRKFKHSTVESNPSVLKCMRCDTVIHVSTSTIVKLLVSVLKILREGQHKIINSQIVETIDELHIPRFKTGRVCSSCFSELWSNVTVEGKRAITVVLEDSDHV